MRALLFIAGPVVLGGLLCWRFPRYRDIPLSRLAVYLAGLAGLLIGALALVAYIAQTRFHFREVLLALWFAIGWRLAAELWSLTAGRWGQKWVRWRRIRRLRRQPAPRAIALIPAGRIALTCLLFAPLFVGTIVTHRLKLADYHTPASVFALDYEPIRFPAADGTMLDGWFIPDGDSDRTIVICHGAGANKSNFIWYLASLGGKGYNILMFDFRAHGSSEGRVSTYGARERYDVQGAVEWLKCERGEQSRIVVGVGSSQGSLALALAAAEDQRIDAVILDSPFVSPRELAHYHAKWVPGLGPAMADLVLLNMSIVSGTSFFDASAEEAVTVMGQRPVMVIHGDEDVIMPRVHAQRLYDAATGPRAIWFGPGPHSNIVTRVPEAYAERVLGFLSTHLPEDGNLRDTSAGCRTQGTRPL